MGRLVDEIMKDVFLLPQARMVSDYELTDMMESPVIQQHFLAMLDGIIGRSFTVKSYESKDAETAKIFTKVINRGIQGIDNFRQSMVETIFLGLGFNEIVWGHSNGFMFPKQISRIPNHLVKWDSDVRGFYIDLTGSGRYWFNDDIRGDIVSVFSPKIGYANVAGAGILETSGVLELYSQYQFIKGCAETISSNYGNNILLFGYDPIEAKTDDGVNALKDRVKDMKDMFSKQTGEQKYLGIPLGGYEQSLKDSLVTIGLSDLKVEPLFNILEGIEKKIEKLLTGAIATDSSSTGSFAREEVTQDRLNSRNTRFSKFIASQMERILELMCNHNGFNPMDYYIEMVREVEGAEQLEFEKKELENQALKLSNTEKFANIYGTTKQVIADLKANGLDDVTISDTLGIDLVIVQTIKSEALALAPNPSGVNTGTDTQKLINEFSKTLGK